MSGAEIVLAVNIAVSATFAASYLIVALMNGSQRGTLWFTATYLLGMVSPISEFFVVFGGAPAWYELLGYMGFLSAALAMSASFRNFHHAPPQWRAIAVIFLAGLAARAWIWDWPRDTLAHGFAYQLPLAAAVLLASWTVRRGNRRSALHLTLAILFGAVAVDLMLKPFFAAAWGPGDTLTSYSASAYAFLSQASTGVLMLVAGMILLLIVTQTAIVASQRASETDLLSGVANRRGFFRQADAMLARSEHRGQPVSVAVFDLDHFKRINDTHGHQTGDEVIAGFGALLRLGAPPSAILARIGGEEFAMMVVGSTAARTWSHAEKIRISALRTTRDKVAATVSGGVAERRAGESLTQMMRRADEALYQAKSEGRDRVHLYTDRTRQAKTPSLS